MSGTSRSSSLTPCRSPTPEPEIMQPDHFYGSEGIQFPPSPKSDGKTWLDPKDDPTASRGIPVFKPTMEQFKDFEAYMEKINCWGQRSGIVKVIPPKEWTESLPSIKPQLKDVKIKTPIEQHMLGNSGLYRQQNMEKRKVMSVREWVELCNKEEFRAPAVHEVGLESRRDVAPRPRRGKKKESTSVEKEPTVKDEAIEVKVAAVPSPPGSEGAASPRPESTPGPLASGSQLNGAGKSKEPAQKSKRQPQSREARQANLAERALKDDEFIEGFDSDTDWLPHNTLASDYTPEFCQKLERHYWRNCGLGKSPWYGADTLGTLYTDETSVWNVGHLPSALDRLLPQSSKGLPGVNTPYLYFGMWRATFAWHVEDMDLYSINYIHFGAPKFWYAVPQAKAGSLEHAMRTYFPKDTSQCHQFLRHKSFLVSPTTLAKYSCRPNHLVQHAGEFVITYPRGYHAGFNLGLNCAESVNFALECWIELGRNAKVCKCVPDSVRIDVDQLIRDRAEEAKEALEESEAPQKPKRSHKKKALAEVPVLPSPVKQEATDRVTLKISKKRKSDEKEEAPKLKKIKLKASPKKPPPPPAVGLALSPSSFASSSKTSVVMLKIPPRVTEPEPYPCCLCVSMQQEGLLAVHEPPVNRRDAVDSANNPKVWMAHELCAKIIPETWVDEFDVSDGTKKKMVFGVGAIVKDRWNLKCSACSRARPKAHGAPVQCTKGKCPKAFHVTCAAKTDDNNTMFNVVREVEKEVVLWEPPAAPLYDPSAMHVDQGANSVYPKPEERVLKTIKKYEVQILCAQHNPAVAAQKRASKIEKIRQDLLALPVDSRIKIRVSSGVFEVSLIRVIEETCSVEVRWDADTKREFKWGSVVFGSTDGLVQQKYSDGLASSSTLPPGPAKSTAAATSTAPAAPAYNPYTQHPQQRTVAPYEYWSYINAAQQMPYTGFPQTYTYPYGAYYSGATAYPNNPSYNMYTYPQPTAGFVPAPAPMPTAATVTPQQQQQQQYRNGSLQWQRPYQGPAMGATPTPGGSQEMQQGVDQRSQSQPRTRETSTSADRPVSRPPSSAQSRNLSADGGQASANLATSTNSNSDVNSSGVSGARSASGNSSSASFASTNVVSSNSPSSSASPPVGTPTSSSTPAPPHQITSVDLGMLAQLPEAQLTEILSNNPSLREVILNALNMNSGAVAQAASYSLT
ncbi:specific transcriptional repressor [Ephemerocybe angulata]|uniref:[histone H3]-trimethyl-L-lysine(9) demethylase n=1 Tax=Ephemerocybe angulata TaxID=980116 RepID=A0A8H6HUT7_9AGAR|nr:specific transcriptional repressor [Tulosesus angulatus]